MSINSNPNPTIIIGDKYTPCTSMMSRAIQDTYSIDRPVTYILPDDNKPGIFKIYAAQDQLIGVVVRSKDFFDIPHGNSDADKKIDSTDDFSYLLYKGVGYYNGVTTTAITSRIGRTGDTSIEQLKSRAKKPKPEAVRVIGSPLWCCRIKSYGPFYSKTGGCTFKEAENDDQKCTVTQLHDYATKHFKTYLPEIWEQQKSELNPEFAFRVDKVKDKSTACSEVFSGVAIQKNLPTDVHFDENKPKDTVSAMLLLGKKIQKEAALILPEVLIKDPNDSNKLKRMAINTRFGDILYFFGNNYVHYSRAAKLNEKQSGLAEDDTDRILVSFYLNNHHTMNYKEDEEIRAAKKLNKKRLRDVPKNFESESQPKKVKIERVKNEQKMNGIKQLGKKRLLEGTETLNLKLKIEKNETGNKLPSYLELSDCLESLFK